MYADAESKTLELCLDQIRVQKVHFQICKIGHPTHVGPILNDFQDSVGLRTNLPTQFTAPCHLWKCLKEFKRYWNCRNWKKTSKSEFIQTWMDMWVDGRCKTDKSRNHFEQMWTKDWWIRHGLIRSDWLKINSYIIFSSFFPSAIKRNMAQLLNKVPNY